MDIEKYTIMNRRMICLKNNIQLKDIFNNIKSRYKKMIIYSFSILISTIIFFTLTMKLSSESEYIFIGKENSIDVDYSYNDGEWYEQLRKQAYNILINKDFQERAFKNSNIDYEDINIKILPKKDTRILEIRVTGFNNNIQKEAVSRITTKFIAEYNEAMKDIKARKINGYYEDESKKHIGNLYSVIIGLIILFIVNLVIILK